MARINWVFQNESGTNLNRYKATNVLTGEVVIFDLLRDSNINVVGTPLSAENLNQLINAINSMSVEIYGHDNAFENVESDIEELNKKANDAIVNIAELNEKANDAIVDIAGLINSVKELQENQNQSNSQITQINNYNLGTLSENPTSTTNSVLNNISKSGFYNFIYSSKTYIMFVHYESYPTQTQIILQQNSTGLVLIKRVKSGTSWAVSKSGNLATENFVNTEIENNKKYVHYIRLEKDINSDKTLTANGFSLNTLVVNNSSTPFNISTLMDYYKTQLSTSTQTIYQATGFVVLYLNSKNTLLQAHSMKINPNYNYIWINYLRLDSNTYGSSGNILLTNTTVYDAVIPM